MTLHENAISAAPGHAVLPTHEVTNQPPELAGWHLLESDLPLREAIEREGAGWAMTELAELGVKLGDADIVEAGRLANRKLPDLKTHDRRGYRVDRVDFHPSYHELMALGFDFGIPTFAARNRRAGGHVAHSAMMYMFYQIDAGVGCPLLMNHAAIPVLRAAPELPPVWLEKVMADRYDQRFIPVEQKAGATIGMAMTEKQGGSDVRANSTTAEPEGERGPGQAYRLKGHKWFCSAPMSDGFLTLAQTGADGEGGISCFLVPRFLPDGTQNRLFLQRLKDKLGNRSNASSEIEYDGAWALLVGEEGRGVATIMQMVHNTRLDVAVTPVALMRVSLVHALHHARHRRAFQKRLIDQPLMRNVLAHLALELEGAIALVFHAAACFDRAATGGEDGRRSEILARFAAAICKYWLNKRAGPFVHEAMECLGGAGYVEEQDMARFYREVPLHGIWEGCGNVVALDLLRTLSKFPDGGSILIEELRAIGGDDPRLVALVDSLEARLTAGAISEFEARRLAGDLATVFQAGLLARGAPEFVSTAFNDAFLDGGAGRDYGTLGPQADIEGILGRVMPEANPAAAA